MPRTDLANGEVSVNLSDGGLGTFDAYIDATSGAPNTKFLPATRLNDTKHVAADQRRKRRFRKNGDIEKGKYKQIGADVQFGPIGPKGGVGVAFGWQAPGSIVRLSKSRTISVDKAPKLATGEIFLKP
ncbi:hypothetical protein B0O99DRAFT_602351 [Bisporella sp. PMI_857]|nr:hypothetical protein B0O99DRAFT_602351 [Bisporella sp. PMI_857]